MVDGETEFSWEEKMVKRDNLSRKPGRQCPQAGGIRETVSSGQMDPGDSVLRPEGSKGRAQTFLHFLYFLLNRRSSQ